MKQKGFTLAELLGVIVILGLIALVTVPTISSTLSKYKDKLCGNQVDYMIASAKNWGADHMLQLPEEGETVTITVSELIKQGYLDGDKKASNEADQLKIKNPKTKKYYNPDPTITITKIGKKYEYIIDSTTVNSCRNRDIHDVVLTGLHTNIENGVTAINQIKNGSFEDGPNGWSNSRIDVAENTIHGTIVTTKVSTGTHSLYMKDTVTTTGFWNYQRLYGNQNDKMYMRSNVIPTSGTASLTVTDKNGTYVGGSNSIKPNANEYYLLSHVYQYSSIANYFQFGSSKTNLAEIYMDDAFVLNLTSTFGAGKDPSQKLLDLIPYFDGQANVGLASGKGTVTFKVTPESGYTLPNSVICTNGTATIQNGTITITGFKQDTSCKIESTK